MPGHYINAVLKAIRIDSHGHARGTYGYRLRLTGMGRRRPLRSGPHSPTRMHVEPRVGLDKAISLVYPV